MNKKIILNFRRKADFLKALAHPTRLLIISELLAGEKCVGGIEKQLSLKQASASQHLNILRTFGVVDYRIEGKNRCYSLQNPSEMRKLLRFIDERS